VLACLAAADVWISAVVPLCLELIETSLDADTLRTTFECLAEVLLYNSKSLGMTSSPQSAGDLFIARTRTRTHNDATCRAATGLGGHKEAITRLLERLSARPEDHVHFAFRLLRLLLLRFEQRTQDKLTPPSSDL